MRSNLHRSGLQTSDTRAVHLHPLILSMIDANDFPSCTLWPSLSLDPCGVLKTEDGKLNVLSFYLDSTGRACISLPVELTFPSTSLLEDCLEQGCFLPKPSGEESGENIYDPEIQPNTQSSMIGIEAKVIFTYGTGTAMHASVEAVRILSSHLHRNKKSVEFDTEIYIRVIQGSNTVNPDHATAKVQLEISAVYLAKRPALNKITDALRKLAEMDLPGDDVSAETNNYSVQHFRSSSFTLYASLTPALEVEVNSVQGPTVGRTFLTLTIRHSGKHKEPVIIDRIALHPSRSFDKKKNTKDANPDLVDLSDVVVWRYLPEADPLLPVTLLVNEAISTILTVDATQHRACGTFCCPVSVVAGLGQREDSYRYQVITELESEWNTSTPPGDGFEISLRLDETVPKVGRLFAVHVNVRNLSGAPRDILLNVCMDDGDGKGPPNDLLFLDDGYLMGIVGGDCTGEASLRFIPLREGCLTVPNLELFDRKSGQKYACYHRLRATVQKSD